MNKNFINLSIKTLRIHIREAKCFTQLCAKNVKLQLAHKRKKYSVMATRMMQQMPSAITCNLCTFYCYTDLIRFILSLGFIGQGSLFEVIKSDFDVHNSSIAFKIKVV